MCLLATAGMVRTNLVLSLVSFYAINTVIIYILLTKETLEPSGTSWGQDVDESGPTTWYYFHASCPCHRMGPSLEMQRRKRRLLRESSVSSSESIIPEIGSHVGPSTCNDYTTSLGYGQKVVAYSFYEPVKPNKLVKTSYIYIATLIQMVN